MGRKPKSITNTTATNWSFWIGLWKAVKNNIYCLVPAVAVYFGANATEIMPENWAKVVAVIASLVVYLIKNKVEFGSK